MVWEAQVSGNSAEQKRSGSSDSSYERGEGPIAEKKNLHSSVVSQATVVLHFGCIEFYFFRNIRSFLGWGRDDLSGLLQTGVAQTEDRH